ncbi:MAG: hypothetical protein PF448_06450 [Bacteroidales bacterium]|jgi:hypothetical protein|nr:hypothetical protein [Bacteroidales bacterium]
MILLQITDKIILDRLVEIEAILETLKTSKGLSAAAGAIIGMVFTLLVNIVWTEIREWRKRKRESKKQVGKLKKEISVVFNNIYRYYREWSGYRLQWVYIAKEYEVSGKENFVMDDFAQICHSQIEIYKNKLYDEEARLYKNVIIMLNELKSISISSFKDQYSSLLEFDINIHKKVKSENDLEKTYKLLKDETIKNQEKLRLICGTTEVQLLSALDKKNQFNNELIDLSVVGN